MDCFGNFWNNLVYFLFHHLVTLLTIIYLPLLLALSVCLSLILVSLSVSFI